MSETTFGVALAARICFVAYERIADYAKFIALFRGAEAGCGIAYLVAGGGLIGAAGSIAGVADGGGGGTAAAGGLGGASTGPGTAGGNAAGRPRISHG